MHDEQSLVHDLIDLDTAVHVSLARLSMKIAEKTPEASRQLSNKSQQQSAKSKKKIPEKSVSKVLKASISSSTGKPDAMITDFSSISPKYTGMIMMCYKLLFITFSDLSE